MTSCLLPGPGDRPAPAGAQHPRGAGRHAVGDRDPAAVRLRPHAAPGGTVRVRRGFASGGLELTVHGIALEGTSVKDLGITLERDGGGLRWTRTLWEGEIGGVVLESMGHAAPGLARRGAAAGGRNGAVLAVVAEPFHLCRPVAGDGRPVRHDVEAADLRARRRPGRRSRGRAAWQAGGERNWDYRYTWIRDGSFSIYALLGLGYVEEAAASGGWLRDRAEEQAGDASGPLKIMYRVDGTSDLAAETLDHFEAGAGLAAGPDRQRRRRPAPAGHLRRGRRCDLPGRQSRPAAGPSGLDGAGGHHRLARAAADRGQPHGAVPAGVARPGPGPPAGRKMARAGAPSEPCSLTGRQIISYRPAVTGEGRVLR